MDKITKIFSKEKNMFKNNVIAVIALFNLAFSFNVSAAASASANTNASSIDLNGSDEKRCADAKAKLQKGFAISGVEKKWLEDCQKKQNANRNGK